MNDGYGVLAQHYSRLFPLNERQRGFFEHLLASGPVNSVLDVGCGTGEHLSWFSSRNIRTWGLEPDPAMFRELERRQWPGRVPQLLRAGVQELPAALGERVDLVLCLGNTLPHLPGRTAAQHAVRGMAETLSPGGRLVLQTVHFDRVLADGQASFPVIRRDLPDGGRISFSREYDLTELPERLLFRTCLSTPDGEERAAWPLVPLRQAEIERILMQAGFREIETFGDYDRSSFVELSPALIVVSRLGQSMLSGF